MLELFIIFSFIGFLYYLVIICLIVLDLTGLLEEPIFETKKQVKRSLFPFLYIKDWWNELD